MNVGHKADHVYNPEFPVLLPLRPFFLSVGSKPEGLAQGRTWRPWQHRSELVCFYLGYKSLDSLSAHTTRTTHRVFLQVLSPYFVTKPIVLPASPAQLPVCLVIGSWQLLLPMPTSTGAQPPTSRVAFHSQRATPMPRRGTNPTETAAELLGSKGWMLRCWGARMFGRQTPS